MRHHTHSPTSKRTLMFSLSIILLFLLASAVLATDSMPKTERSTSSAQEALRQPFVLHLAPDADLEMIHRALDKLSVTVEDMGQIESASPLVLYIEASPGAIFELKRISGVLDVASSREAASNQTLQSGDGNITGRVTDSNGTPLPNIDVNIYTFYDIKGWYNMGNAKSDISGQYNVSGVSTGTYRVSFYDAQDQYAREYYDNVLHIGSATDIVVTGGQTITGIDASLEDAGHITGTVTDESGNPLADIGVRAYLYNEDSASWQLRSFDDTDSEGQYDITSLNTGSYRVHFYDTQGNYLPEYYDNADDLESATNIAVTGGLTTTGIDASLRLAGHIYGTVTDEEDNPLATIGVSVYQYNEESDEWEFQRSDYSNEDGQYDVGGLNTGNYRVGFYDFTHNYLPEYYDNADDLESATNIAVTAGQTTTGIDASLTLKGRITGTVTDESGNPLADIGLTIYQYNEEFDYWQSLESAQTDEYGQYDVGALNTGTYRVGFYDVQEEYTTEYYDNAPDIESATDIAVTAGQIATGIDASLALKGRINGRVTDESGNPLAGIEVTVYQYNEEFDYWQSFMSGYGDSEGLYDVGYLNPGTYRVRFYDEAGNYLSEYYDNAPNIESATNIIVTEGQTTTGIDASLTLRPGITGTVTDESNNPLADIEVRAYKFNEVLYEWQFLESDNTDGDGKYNIGPLNTGTYRVRFDDEAGNYLSEYYDNAPDFENATDIAVTMGQVTTGIDASLSLAGHITGTVTDADGNKLQNIVVTIYANSIFGGFYYRPSWVDNTDSEGKYNVGSLNTGTYRVRFYDEAGNYLTEYYDNALDIESATDIAVTSGQTTTGIDASLTLKGRITGTVTDQEDNPLADIRVRVYQYNEGSDNWQLRESDETDEYGQYDVDRLNTGTYRVRFDDSQGQYATEYYDNALSIWKATDITVTVGETTTGIDGSLKEAGHITGTVTDADGNAVPRIYASVYQYNEQFDEWQWMGSDETDDFGQYDVGGLNTTSYRVRFYDDQGQNATEYYDNALEIEGATDIAVIAGQTTTEIDASLIERGHITGIVTDESNNPLAGIGVTLYQYNKQSDDWQSLDPYYTDSEGQYHSDLEMGSYRVRFYDGGSQYATKYYDDALTIEQGTDVTITVGQSTSGIDASLSLAGHITGAVTNESGYPLPDIEVNVYQYNEQKGNWEQIDSDYTNFDGQYDVDRLKPGTYRVHFLDLRKNYLSEYYNNGDEIESATDVMVISGQTTSDIDASLTLKGRITGTVTDADGNPLPSIYTVVYQYNELIDDWEWANSDYSNLHGQYDIEDLNPGTYRVHFLDLDNNYLSEYYDNADDIESATDLIVIGGQTTSEIDASLAIAGSLAGTVRASDGSLLENVAVDVYRSDGLGGWQWAGWDYSNGIGNYVVTGLSAGTYRVGFFDWEGVYFPKYYEDAIDLANATEIALTAGEKRAEIDVTLADGGHITGTVSHELSSVASVAAGSKPLSGIEVQAYRNQGGEWQWVRSATTDAEGSYDIGGLASGTYRVGFFEPFGKYAYEYYDDSSNLAGATNISVTAGQSTPNIDAILADAATPLAQVTSEGGVSVDAQTGQITIMRSVHNGNASDVTISLLVTCPDGETASDVTLHVGETSYLMTVDGNQQYSATIPTNAIVDDAQITRSNLCNGNPIEQAIGQLQRFEPTGQITDAETGEPVAGATVVLYKVPGWQVRTSPIQNNTPNTCKSKLSRPSNPSWSQKAPTELGVMALPDSGEIEPAINPLQSDAEGYYGWDVVKGCWYVVVEAAGYDRFVSPVVGMPPDITDLDLTLTPKEPLRVQFRAVNYQINENHGSAQVAVIVTTPPTQTLTVEYSTSNNTAMAGEDYTTATGSLTFAAGETINTFNVPILDDEVDEGHETINLTLSNATNVALGERDQATLTITDDNGQITSSHEIYLPLMSRTSD